MLSHHTLDKLKLNNHNSILFFNVGIEAADLTSLLEQFEETQGNLISEAYMHWPVALMGHIVQYHAHVISISFSDFVMAERWHSLLQLCLFAVVVWRVERL